MWEGIFPRAIQRWERLLQGLGPVVLVSAEGGVSAGEEGSWVGKGPSPSLQELTGSAAASRLEVVATLPSRGCGENHVPGA